MNDRQYERIGRTIATISYWLYALKFIAVVTVIALIPLYIFDKPLFIAPIIGVVVFFIYRSIRRAIFRLLYKLSRM